MAITKSAKKALRQSQRRKERNVDQKNKMKALLKKVNSLAAQKKTEEVRKMLPLIYKALDKAAKNNLIKKNTASRKKSRITKMIERSSK